MTESRNNLQKYAMYFSAYMGIYWIFKFILLPLGLLILFLLFLFFGLTLRIPLMGYYYARTYRGKTCGGSIRLLQAWVFIVFMYMFTALLTVVVHYIYFRFTDHGFIVNTYMEIFDELTNKNTLGVGGHIGQLKEAVGMVSILTPTDIIMQLMSQNVFCGNILAVPTALFVMRKPKSPEIQPLQFIVSSSHKKWIYPL